MHKKMSYRRYERLLLTKRYTSDEAMKAGDSARTVSFQEDVMEIPKSLTPEKSPTKSTENGSAVETKSIPTSISTSTSSSSSTSTPTSFSTSSSTLAQTAQSLSSMKSRSYSSYSSSLNNNNSSSSSSTSSSSRSAKLKSESSAESSHSSTYVSYTSRFRESVAASAAASKSLATLRETHESTSRNAQSFSSEKTQHLSLSAGSTSSIVNGSKINDSTANGNANDSSSMLNGALSSTLKAFYRPKEEESTKGKYVNWSTQHAILADQPWCCIGDLMSLCDKYEFKTIALHDTRTHNAIIAEVTALLRNGNAPFDMRKRFPGNIHEPENLWVCIGRCAGVEYHLKRIISTFRKPLDKLQPDKQRVARQNFHLSINELRLDISARISEVRLYDRNVFEKDFNLKWEDNVED